MSVHLEIGYIGLDRPSMETLKQFSFSTDHETMNMKKDGLTLVETELRLGPLGSQSPDHYPKGVLTTSQCGVKRGFCEAIDDSKKWGVFGSHESEFHLRKEALLFSSKCNLENNAKHTSFETPSPSPNLVHEMKSRQPFLKDSENGITSGKVQVVGWPPIRSFSKNTMAITPSEHTDDHKGNLGLGCQYVKVSMDAAPYLRKVDIKTYCSYVELSAALETMFRCFTFGLCNSHGVAGQEGERKLKDLLHSSEYVLTYEDKDGDWMLVGDVPWEMFVDSCKKLRIMKSSEAIGLCSSI